MIKFKTLSIQNFLSYGATPTVINLDPGGTTLIVGEDLDNTASGTGANGVGKTVWLNALVFALYGKPVSNISMDNLVNNINNTHLEVIVEFQKDDKLYVVKRVRKEKGLGNYARVYERPVGIDLDLSVNSVQDVTPDSVKHINDFIANILGIPHELFVRIVAFSATHTPFLDLPVRHASQANQSDIIEELFRLNRLSEKAALLKVAMKDTKTSLEIKQTHNDQLEKEHERHTELLSTAKSRVNEWIKENKDSMVVVKKELKELNQQNIDRQQKLFDEAAEQNENVIILTTSLNDINAQIKEFAAEHKASGNEIKILGEQFDGMQDKIDVWNIEHKIDIDAHEEAKEGLVSEEVIEEQQKLHDRMTELSKNYQILEDDAEEYESEISTITDKIEKAADELSHLEDAKCPYCLQKYEDVADKIKGCKADISDDNTYIKKSKSELKNLRTKQTLVADEIEKVDSDIKYDLSNLSIEIKLREDLFNKIDELKAMENPFNMDEADKLEKRIEVLDCAMEALDLEIDDLTIDGENTEKDIKTEEAVLVRIAKKIEFESLEALWEVKGNITRLDDKLKELKTAKNPHQESYKELLGVELEPIDMDTINHLDKLLTHQNYLLKLLTKKDSFIRKNLLNKNLSFLNTRLRGYLNDLGLPHRVEFTQEMTAHISQFGRQLDFGNLSSGQKARVNLALSFSFRDVLQRSLDSVNICMLDEVLDVGLDTVGVQNAAHMLKRKAREDELTLFIISHRDEVSGIFDKTLTVTMEKGFSSISQVA